MKLKLEAERALRLAVKSGDTKAYLERFGHFVESANSIHPTLCESPELLKQHMAAVQCSKVTPDERMANIRREHTAAENFVRSLRGPRGFLARRLLNAGQSHVTQIDNSVFHFKRALALMRKTFLEAGQRLVQRGILVRVEDVFYMERDEVWAPPADLGKRMGQRRLLCERQKRLAPPPSIPPFSDPVWGSDWMLPREPESRPLYLRKKITKLSGSTFPNPCLT